MCVCVCVYTFRKLENKFIYLSHDIAEKVAEVRQYCRINKTYIATYEVDVVTSNSPKRSAVVFIIFISLYQG